MTFCIHGLFYILNQLGTVDIWRNDHGAVKCIKYADLGPYLHVLTDFTRILTKINDFSMLFSEI